MVEWMASTDHESNWVEEEEILWPVFIQDGENKNYKTSWKGKIGGWRYDVSLNKKIKRLKLCTLWG